MTDQAFPGADRDRPAAAAARVRAESEASEAAKRRAPGPSPGLPENARGRASPPETRPLRRCRLRSGGQACTSKTAIIPDMSCPLVTCGRMWQWKSHLPGLSAVKVRS